MQGGDGEGLAQRGGHGPDVGHLGGVEAGGRGHDHVGLHLAVELRRDQPRGGQVVDQAGHRTLAQASDLHVGPGGDLDDARAVPRRGRGQGAEVGGGERPAGHPQAGQQAVARRQGPAHARARAAGPGAPRSGSVSGRGAGIPGDATRT